MLVNKKRVDLQAIRALTGKIADRNLVKFNFHVLKTTPRQILTYRITYNNSRGNCEFLPFFLRELLEVSKIHFHKKCIMEAFPDRFFISFSIFSHLKRSQTILCEFFYCRSKKYKTNLPSIPIKFCLVPYARIIRGRKLLEVLDTFF